MKRLHFLLVGLSLILAVGPAHGSGGGPWCPPSGAYFEFGGVQHYFGSPNAQGKCPIGNIGYNLLGSPSGLASPGIPYSLVGTTQVLWIGSQAVSVYDAFSSFGLATECGDPYDSYAYEPHLLAGSSGTFHPTFGGSGTILFWLDGNEPQYYGNFANTLGRSTDIEGDGDTDEADEAEMRAAIARAESPINLDAKYDLDWSGAVDSADLGIMMVESRRRDGGARYGRSVCRQVGYEGQLVPYSAATDLYVIPPSTPTNITISRRCGFYTSVQWTNGGDDGTSGNAHKVEVRTSTTGAITDANFSSATLLGAPSAGVYGSIQQLPISIATSTSVRYIAVRSFDDSGEPSGVLCSPALSVTELTPPATTTNLTAVRVSGGGPGGQARLRWTSAGDDGNSGTATAYDLRYSEAPISGANFAGALPISTPPPSSPGTQITVYFPMDACEQYYFALKTVDDQDNCSGVSNSPTATGQCQESGLVAGDGADRPETPIRLSLAVGVLTSDGVEFVLDIPAEHAGAPLQLSIHDILGRRVASPLNTNLAVGRQTLRWNLLRGDGTRIPSGVYAARIVVNGEARSAKFSVVR